MKHTTPFLLALLLGLGILFNACEQNEIVPPNNPPVDTTPVDTTSNVLPAGSFDFVLVQVNAVPVHHVQINRWEAIYEVVLNGLNPDSVELHWQTVQADNYQATIIGSVNNARQLNLYYRQSCADVVKLTVRYGNKTGTVTKTFQINQIYPTPPPSFDIYRVLYYQMPATRPDGSAWDDVFHTYDTTSVPDFFIRTNVHEQFHCSVTGIYPDSQMVVRSDRIPLYLTNEGTPDYNVFGSTDLLLYDWDGPGLYDTVATLQFVASQHKIPGSSYATVTFQQAGYHIVLYLRYNYYP
jgi:hypothetical protein